MEKGKDQRSAPNPQNNFSLPPWESRCNKPIFNVDGKEKKRKQVSLIPESITTERKENVDHRTEKNKKRKETYFSFGKKTIKDDDKKTQENQLILKKKVFTVRRMEFVAKAEVKPLG